MHAIRGGGGAPIRLRGGGRSVWLGGWLGFGGRREGRRSSHCCRMRWRNWSAVPDRRRRPARYTQSRNTAGRVAAAFPVSKRSPRLASTVATLGGIWKPVGEVVAYLRVGEVLLDDLLRVLEDGRLVEAIPAAGREAGVVGATAHQHHGLRPRAFNARTTAETRGRVGRPIPSISSRPSNTGRTHWSLTSRWAWRRERPYASTSCASRRTVQSPPPTND